MKGKGGGGPDGLMFFLSFNPSMILHILIKENRRNFGGLKEDGQPKGTFGGQCQDSSGFHFFPLTLNET